MAVSVSKNSNIGWPASSRIPPPSHKASSEEPLGSGPLSWGAPLIRCRHRGRPPPRRSGGCSSPGRPQAPGRAGAFRAASCSRAPRLHLPQLVVPSTSSRARERVRHPEPQTPEFGAEADPLQDHAGSERLMPPAPSSQTGLSEASGGEGAQGWLLPGRRRRAGAAAGEGGRRADRCRRLGTGVLGSCRCPHR